jgi:hypothetical protein
MFDPDPRLMPFSAAASRRIEGCGWGKVPRLPRERAHGSSAGIILLHFYL